MNYANLLSLHQKSTKKLIYSSDVSLIIRLPAVVVSSNVNPLFGDMNRETSTTGLEKGPYYCLWYDALTAKSMGKSNSKGIEQVMEQSAGQLREATAFAEVWLDDVLIDKSNDAGQTWFDKAQHVVVGTERFKVLGVAKLGLSIGRPYLAMVGLKGGLGFDES